MLFLVAVGSRSLTKPDVFLKWRGTRLLPRDSSRKETRLESKHYSVLPEELMREVIFLLSRAEKTNTTPSSCLQRRKIPAPCLCQLLGGVICSPSCCIPVSDQAVLLLCFPLPSFALPQLQFKENTQGLPRRRFWHGHNVLNTAIKIFFILTWK